MAAEFVHDRVAVLFGVLLDGVADVAESGARTHLGDAEPHAFESDITQSSGLDRNFADREHAAGITEIAVLDGGDVDVEDVTVLERLVAGDAMANLMIDGDARCLGVGFVTGGRVIQGGRNGLLHLDHVFMAEPVELAGCDARLDERGDVVENFRR